MDVGYFAYGSNLNMFQMMKRVGEWSSSKKAYLQGYRLVFNVDSPRWGGFAANLQKTDNESDKVYGVVYFLRKEKLGEFSLDGEGDDCYFLQNGFYRINGVWKQRGIGKLGSKEIEHLDTIQRDGKLYYSFKINRVGRLRNSIISNKIGDIGKFKIYEKQVNLNADRKRMWMGELDGINNKSNKSIPLSFNHFTRSDLTKEWHFK